MSVLSKAWKGVKKGVKKAARGIKKLAKKVAYATPWGKKLWDFSSKVGEGAMKVIGKVTNALGPVGMIALSVIAPYAAPLWSAFGAAASAAGGFWGSVGTAIYNGANWVGGTLSSMTSGISKGLSTLAEGGLKGLGSSLGKAGAEMAKGFTQAFSGEAGKAGVQKGIEAATNSAIQSAAGNSVLEQTKSQILGDAAGSGTQETLGQTLDKVNTNLDAIQTTGELPTVGQDLNLSQTDFSVQNFAEQGSSQFQPQTLETQASNAVLRPEGTGNQSGKSLLDKAGKVAKSLLAGTQPVQSSLPLAVGDPGGERFFGDAFAKGGVGSSGGQFLTEQQRKAFEFSTQQLTRGFG